MVEMSAEVESCPKCGRSRRGEPACPNCGLSADRMESFAANREAAVPDQLRAAWDDLHAPDSSAPPYRGGDPWSDQARHDELLKLVAANNCYAWAAGRYREVIRTRPEDTTAARQLDRLTRAAEATMLAGATARGNTGPKPYRAVTAVLVMLIVAVVSGLLYAMVIHKDDPSGTATPARPAPSSQR
jgi:hypothetical protein